VNPAVGRPTLFYRMARNRPAEQTTPAGIKLQITLNSPIDTTDLFRRVRSNAFTQRVSLRESSMRKHLSGLGLSVGLCVGLGSTGLVRADSPKPSAYEKDVALSTSHHMTTAEQRIYERASLEARERLARIEGRHRQGISLQRPAVYSTSLLATGTPPSGLWHYSWYCPCP